MTLIPDWKRRWRKLWSIRLAALSALLSGAELAVPYLDGLIRPHLLAALAAATAIGAALARLVAQPKAAPERRASPRPPPITAHRAVNDAAARDAQEADLGRVVERLSTPDIRRRVPRDAMPPGRSWRGEAPLYPIYPPHKRPPP